ncbi:PhoH family protein [Maridesulfovibrio salexigens]|uniref:PhoH family protein n=1 Tax=Maridesulfovibrio salexigens (strain ATCC 14822 / DSM 2638 / NCIMB 8403 / VKM B-1763) TaxID=526222 RepID=C6C236_MARSD|nr:PhoH family protein [Maridesulfovibrio salexigens]ACS81237.1 PhoH family protein [Maridesulfovibrio salexigens DSM 2638]
MGQKNFVLDTNVLIENPKCITALRNGVENNVHLPYTVITELDKLKRDPRIGHIVSQAVRSILKDDKISILSPDFAEKLGSLSPDDRILKETLNAPIDDPILVTNDRILQIKAGIHNLTWEEYKDSDPFRSDSQMYTGFVDEDETPYVNSFRWENGTPVFYGNKENKTISYTHEVWGVKPRNIYQNLALELMLNNEINLVSIQSEAGYGKTFLALASALYLALEKKDNPFEKVYLVKPIWEIGAKMGFLPGSVEEKMQPYVRYVRDLTVKLHEQRPANRIFMDTDSEKFRFNQKKFEILPIAYIRGMNLENCVVIIDEMQNMSRSEVRSLLTRMGEGVKCICLGDTRQVDNPYLNESNNGLNWVVKKLRDNKEYAHMVLKGERSRGPITDMVLKTGL